MTIVSHVSDDHGVSFGETFNYFKLGMLRTLAASVAVGAIG
jgi:hypothetical protein